MASSRSPSRFSIVLCSAYWWRASANGAASPNSRETFLFTLGAQLAGAIGGPEASGDIDRLLRDSDESRFALKGVSATPGAAVGRGHVVYLLANLDAIPDRASRGCGG